MRIKQLLSIAVLFVLFTSYFPSKTLATSWSYSIGFCDDYIIYIFSILDFLAVILILKVLKNNRGIK
jgi:hypothetical protein